MHPNWKAISTVYIKHQPFVTEAGPDCNELKIKKTSFANSLLKGAEAKNFYEDIISLKSQESGIKKKRVDIKFKSNERRSQPHLTFNQFCCAVMQNNSLKVDETCRVSPQMINQKDQYNWTPIMMAACEGASETFEILLKYNCDINTTDRKGNSVYSLAKKRGHTHILALLMKYFKSNIVQELDESVVTNENTEFYCDLCKYNFKESSKTEHITSTVHQFNLEHHRFPIRFGIDEHNRGFQLMLKQGWNKESGLGPEQSGSLFPVKTQIREFRTGLGVQQKNEERVTHFKPYDLAAIKRNNIPPKAMNKRDFERKAKRDRYREQKIRKSLS